MGTHADLRSHDEVRSILHDILERENLLDANIEIAAGAQKCDGFLSSMNKVTVKGNGRVLHLILKCAPKGEEFRKLIPLTELFARETYFYETIYPEMMKFQGERNISHPFDNVPRVYKTVETYCMETIVMENIRELGFDLVDRREFMDDEHICLVLKKYGEFHAISFAMQDQNRELYESITHNLDDVFGSFPDEFFQQMQVFWEKTADLFDGENEGHFKDALLKFRTLDFLKSMKHRTKYHVINHGDCWCNNMMFKYDKSTKKLSDMKLLDFQLCRASSPVYDLGYFFYVSTGKETHLKLDHYLGIYYESLSKRTKELGSEINNLYPYSALKEDWKQYARFGFVMSQSIIKAVLMEGDEMIDIKDMAESDNGFDEFLDKKFKHEDLANERIKNVASHVIKSGFLE